MWKERRAEGADGMEGKCLKYRGEIVKEEMRKLANMVWEGERMMEE